MGADDVRPVGHGNGGTGQRANETIVGLGLIENLADKGLARHSHEEGKTKDRRSASARKTRQSHSSQAIPGSRKNPIPGSSTICCSGIPACSARVRLSVSAFRIRSKGDPLWGCCSLAIRIAPAPKRAISGAMAGSFFKPLTSLIIRAPALRRLGPAGPAWYRLRLEPKQHRQRLQLPGLNARFLVQLKYLFLSMGRWT